jgi:phosphoribosylamine--glycine ligase
MPAAQDHPHAFENDQGPITGGMGSYSDKKGLLPFLSQKNYDDAVKIMKKTVIAIKDKASPYKGILYGQFMLSKDGPQLIEYNARFGDPEVMNVLPLLKNPMVDVCQSIVDGNLKKVSFEDKASVCKYIVPNAYPETKSQNKIVTVNEDKINQLGANVFYAAVNQKEDGIYTTSSRSLAIVASAETIFKSEQIVEEAGTHVSGDLYHRRDIGTETIIQKRINNMKEIRGC